MLTTSSPAVINIAYDLLRLLADDDPDLGRSAGHGCIVALRRSREWLE